MTVAAQLKVHRNGHVTIGQVAKPTASKLSVGGTVITDGIIVPYVTNPVEYADTPCETDSAISALSSVMSMDVVKYAVWSDEDDPKQPATTRYALAPDVLKLLYPTLVCQTADDIEGVNYTELVPLLVRSIQELQQEVEQLKTSLISLNNSRRQTRSGSLQQDAELRYSAALMQNSPNPVREQAIIGYTLVGDYTEAAICIYDMKGNAIKTFDIHSGTNSVMVNSSEFGSGLYLYSLIVDGNVVDTKKMIVSK